MLVANANRYKAIEGGPSYRDAVQIAAVETQAFVEAIPKNLLHVHHTVGAKDAAAQRTRIHMEQPQWRGGGGGQGWGKRQPGQQEPTRRTSARRIHHLPIDGW
jgi:hypothetical protein